MIKQKRIGSLGHILQLDLRQFTGRAFFTTDIHGCFDLLHEQMRENAFDTSKDIIISGADWVDRGPDSRYVLDYLEESWIFSVQANHESLFVGAYEEGFDPAGRNTNCIMMNGGAWITSLGKAHAKAIYETFKELPVGIEVILKDKTVGVVHTAVPYNDWLQFKHITQAEMDWDGLNTCQWDRSQYDSRAETVVKGIDIVYHGHSPTRSGEVEQYGNRIYCDLGSFYRDKIAFIEINKYDG